MIPCSPRVLCQRIPYEHHGLLALPQKVIFDFQLSRPNVMRVLAVPPGRTVRERALLSEIRAGDRILCYSDTEGPLEISENRQLVPLSMILAVLPQRAPDAAPVPA
jgi:hypothetical protein